MSTKEKPRRSAGLFLGRYLSLIVCAAGLPPFGVKTLPDRFLKRFHLPHGNLPCLPRALEAVVPCYPQACAKMPVESPLGLTAGHPLNDSRDIARPVLQPEILERLTAFGTKDSGGRLCSLFHRPLGQCIIILKTNEKMKSFPGGVHRKKTSGGVQ